MKSDKNSGNILTFEGKRGVTSGYESSPYTGQFQDAIYEYSERIEKELRPYDYGRLDFRCNPSSGEIYLLETNLICNNSSGTVLAKAAKEKGVSYSDLIEHILATSIFRQKHKLGF